MNPTIRNTRIPGAECKELGKALALNTTLKIVKLGNNPFKEPDIELLFHGLTTTSLYIIGLEVNLILSDQTKRSFLVSCTIRRNYHYNKHIFIKNYGMLISADCRTYLWVKDYTKGCRSLKKNRRWLYTMVNQEVTSDPDPWQGLLIQGTS